jgi:hypothetical protein
MTGRTYMFCGRILAILLDYCETWVPLGPHRPGSQSSLTSGFGPSEDPPTYQ